MECDRLVGGRGVNLCRRSLSRDARWRRMCRGTEKRGAACISSRLAARLCCCCAGATPIVNTVHIFQRSG
jgi:hypothetical protein